MPIAGIEGVSPFAPISPTRPDVTAPAGAADGGTAFAAQLTGAIDEAQRLSGVSNELTVAALTGDLTDLHAATIASSRASLTLEVMVAMRNKGVEAFNDVMRMQA